MGENCPKTRVLMFWGSIPCVLFVHKILKVRTHDLSVMPMSVMGFQKSLPSMSSLFTGIPG